VKAKHSCNAVRGEDDDNDDNSKNSNRNDRKKASSVGTAHGARKGKETRAEEPPPKERKVQPVVKSAEFVEDSDIKMTEVQILGVGSKQQIGPPKGKKKLEVVIGVRPAATPAGPSRGPEPEPTRVPIPTPKPVGSAPATATVRPPRLRRAPSKLSGPDNSSDRVLPKLQRQGKRIR